MVQNHHDEVQLCPPPGHPITLYGLTLSLLKPFMHTLTLTLTFPSLLTVSFCARTFRQLGLKRWWWGAADVAEGVQ